MPDLYVVRTVVKTEGDVESGDDGVEIVFDFHAELPEQCQGVSISRSSAAWDRTKQGLYPFPFERKMAGRNVQVGPCQCAQLCAIGARNQNSTRASILREKRN